MFFRLYELLGPKSEVRPFNGVQPRNRGIEIFPNICRISYVYYVEIAGQLK